MTMFTLLTAVSVAALGAGQVPAESGKPGDGGEKKICREVGPPTGSILSRKRVCYTKSQWAEINKANAASVTQFQADRDRAAAH